MRAEILDSATLQRLQSLEFSLEKSPCSSSPVFSPDGRILTSFVRPLHHDDIGGFVISWDLQTGGIISAIEFKAENGARLWNSRITHSMNGQIVALLTRYESSTVISVYDIVPGIHTHNIYHDTCTNPNLTLGAPFVYDIWTHGESLRFAIPGPTEIKIWEVVFTPGATPTEVETVSIPNTPIFKSLGQMNIAWTEFHPASYRLAIGAEDTLLVWDARASKFLLHRTGLPLFLPMNFSSDGRFFACTTSTTEVELWKESPTGYTLFEKLTSHIRDSKPRFSPNCESLVTFSGATIQLWHIKGLTTTTYSDSAQAIRHTGQDFILEFFPDRPLAVFTRKGDKVVTVLDLECGFPRSTIDASIEVYGLEAIEDTIAVIGSEKAITWNLSGGNFHPGARMNVEDSTQTINFRTADDTVIAASISLDLRYIALARHTRGGEDLLDVYCAPTWRNLQVREWGWALWFDPGGDHLWCTRHSDAEVFTIAPDALNHTMTVVDIEQGSWGCPWGSSHGYKVADDGWILGGGGKRLLMLPPLWRSLKPVNQVWNGRFLAHLCGALPGPVILEFEP